MGNRNNKDKEIKETKESQKEIKSPKSGTRDELLKQKINELLETYDMKEINKVLHSITRSKSSKKHINTSEEKSTIKNPLSVEPVDIYNIPEELKARAIKLFNAADKDNSGTIDEYELYDLLKEIMGPITMAESNSIYQAMDINHSGTITYDEFVSGLIRFNWDTSKVQTAKTGWDWEIPYNELKITKELGSGTHGTVYLAKWNGLDVAVKKLTGVNKEKVLEEFKNEVSILGKLRHPNILLFMGACTNQEHMTIVTEYLEGGNLYDILKQVTFDLKMTVKLAKQIAFGLNYLHLRGIIHRDLKAENLLVDRYYNVKLCDFGLSCLKPTDGGKLKRRTGSPVCIAPEMWIGKEAYDEKVDVYSYSITVWEILAGIEVLEDPGFRHIEDEPTLKDAVVNKKLRPMIPNNTPIELASLLKSCWDEDPKKRPNFALIIALLETISESL